MNMQNIRFDDGYKEFMINDDPNKVIRFDPTDFAIIERFNTAMNNIEKYKDEFDNNEDTAGGLESAAETVNKINTYIREQIDYIFDSPVAAIALGNKSPLAMVKGVPLFERFLNAVIPAIEKEIKAEMKASEKRVSKYTSQVK